LLGVLFDRTDGGSKFLRNVTELSLPPASPDSLLGLLFDLEDGDDMFLRNVGLCQLHGVTSQKTVLPIGIVVRR
jgi:hypothetical protein